MWLSTSYYASEDLCARSVLVLRDLPSILLSLKLINPRHKPDADSRHGFCCRVAELYATSNTQGCIIWRTAFCCRSRTVYGTTHLVCCHHQVLQIDRALAATILFSSMYARQRAHLTTSVHQPFLRDLSGPSSSRTGDGHSGSRASQRRTNSRQSAATVSVNESFTARTVSSLLSPQAQSQRLLLWQWNRRALKTALS